LPQILPLFPDNINVFIDLFSGGGNIGLNVKANQIICNDIIEQVINFCKECRNKSSTEMVEVIHKNIDTYKLSKTNAEGYLRLRKDYNDGKRAWDIFYTLVCYSFNNQIRFNRKQEYNMPFGKDRSSFNPTLEEKFIGFVDAINKKNIKFVNKDFREIPFNKLKSDDFVYADPPYLITCASYNEQDGWNKEKEIMLLNILDELNDRGVKFALSNVLESKGKSNDILKEWSNKYIIHKLNCSYGNASYQRKDKNKDTSLEVLVTNYKPLNIVSD
jgi:DNA adenine methylase Dam